MVSKVEEFPLTEPRAVWVEWPEPEYVVNASRRHRILSRLLGLPTDEEVEAEMLALREAEKNLPEIVPPDDPDRLEFEAWVRSIGGRPAATWKPRVNRKPVRNPDWRDWLRARLSG